MKKSIQCIKPKDPWSNFLTTGFGKLAFTCIIQFWILKCWNFHWPFFFIWIFDFLRETCPFHETSTLHKKCPQYKRRYIYIYRSIHTYVYMLYYVYRMCSCTVDSCWVPLNSNSLNCKKWHFFSTNSCKIQEVMCDPYRNSSSACCNLSLGPSLKRTAILPPENRPQKGDSSTPSHQFLRGYEVSGRKGGYVSPSGCWRSPVNGGLVGLGGSEKHRALFANSAVAEMILIKETRLEISKQMEAQHTCEESTGIRHTGWRRKSCKTPNTGFASVSTHFDAS